MIARSSGEVTFDDLRIVPQAILAPAEVRRSHALPIPGWSQLVLGIRHFDRGLFEVEAISDQQRRVQVVLVAHQHAFYQADTFNDSERRAFHQGLITTDLAAQREFSWGQVFCRLDSRSNKDWLLVAYTLGP